DGALLRRLFDDQQPLPLMRHRRDAAHAEHLSRGALDGEWVERAARIFDHRVRSAEEPEPSTLVEIADVARAVPDDAVDGELRLVVADAAEIPTHDVRTGDDDLTGR